MCGPKAIKPGGQCKLMLKILCKLNSYLAFGENDGMYSYFEDFNCEKYKN